MKSKYIYKAGGILIKDKKFMLEKHGGNEVFIIPGGKLEEGETAEQALVRELEEEFHIKAEAENFEVLGHFESPAVHAPEKIVKIKAYIVDKWQGEFKLDDGIEAVVWVNSKSVNEVTISPITREILPILLEGGWID